MEKTTTDLQYSHIPALLNKEVSAWCNQFDNPPELYAQFTAAHDDRLMFNGYSLGVLLSEIDKSSIYHDVQWFGFTTTYGADFDFKICWPFGKNTTPSVEYIRRSIPKAK